MPPDNENSTQHPMADDDLPDWLREIRGASSESTSEPASTSPEMEPESDSDLPAWLHDVEADDAPSPQASVEESEDEEDDWLKILADEGIELDDLPEDRPEGAENMSLQDWLAATSEESPLADKARQEAKAVSQKPTSEAPEAVEPDDVVDDELPDWLRSGQPAEAETPAWLMDESMAEEDEEAPEEEEEPAAAASSLADDGMVVEDELPDWLRFDQPAEAEAETPAWLMDESMAEADEEAPEEEEEPVAAASSLADDGMVVEDELPDWLRSDQPAEAEAETPAWLMDESMADEGEEAPEEEEEPAAAAGSLADDGMVVEDELPDWLRFDQPAEAEAKTPAWLMDESTHDAIIEVEDEPAEAVTAADEALFETEDEEGALPDWLQGEELEPADLDDLSLEEEEMVDVDGLPDWLRDEAVVDESESEADISVPEWLAETPQAEPASAGFIAEEDEDDSAPDWLDTSSVEVDEVDEAAIEIDEAPIRGARVPGWLERLREGEGEAGPETETPPVSPVERQPETIVAASAEAGEAKLSVATATLESGDLDEALKIYQDLIESAHGLDQIIESLSSNLARFGSQVAIHEVLGDAYARNGQLNRALASYQMALKQLES